MRFAPDWMGLGPVLEPDYVTYYSGYTINQYPTELAFYGTITEHFDIVGISIDDVYKSFQIGGFFNWHGFQDIWVGYDPMNWVSGYVNVNTKSYFRYLTLNFGLGGIITKKTPNQMITGYTDPVLEKIRTKKVYLGGDATINSWIQIDPPNSRAPTGNVVSFLTGETEEESTRQYGLWNNQEWINVQGAEYVTTLTTQPAALNPWSSKHYLQGTDGRQFAPDLQKGPLEVFDPTVSRFIAMEYQGEEAMEFEEQTVYNYKIQQNQL